MTVRPVDILVVVAALGVVLFVALLPSPRDNNPAVPDSAEHRGLRSERECLRCHAAGAAQALPERHPPRTDCFRCHRLAEGRQTVFDPSDSRGTHVTRALSPETRAEGGGWVLAPTQEPEAPSVRESADREAGRKAIWSKSW